MDAFQTFRKQAADKRDAIIRAARAEFREAKKRINALRIQLGASAKEPPPVKLRNLTSVIAEVMPRDHAFTIGELAELVAKAEPGRRFLHGTVRTLCQKMVPAGGIRRVGRVSGKTMWAAPSYSGKIDLESVKRLPQVAADVLRVSGPLRSADLLQRIRERGYRTAEGPRKVLKSLQMAAYHLGTGAGRTRPGNGRWCKGRWADIDIPVLILGIDGYGFFRSSGQPPDGSANPVSPERSRESEVDNFPSRLIK